MSLRPATPADFGFIRSLTLSPDYAPYLTDEDEAGLAVYLTDRSARLLIWEEAGQPAGFVLWCNIGHPSGTVELCRLALAAAGGGRGLSFVKTLTDYGFETLGARKIWLDASGENLRAQRVYEKAGYQLEGCQRAHWWRPALGRVVDVMLFGMLRDEWQALAPAPSASYISTKA
jgi:RimJ/RimL family protein N-acetyltransferase